MTGWGYGASANEIASHFLDDIYELLIRRINVALMGDNNSERRMAACLLAHCMQLPKFSMFVYFHDEANGYAPISEFSLCGYAVSVIDQLLCDHEWLNSFADGEEIVLSLNADRNFIQEQWSQYQKNFL